MASLAPIATSKKPHPADLPTSERDLLLRLILLKDEATVELFLKKQMDGESDVLQSAKNTILKQQDQLLVSITAMLKENDIAVQNERMSEFEARKEDLMDYVGFRDGTTITILDARLAELGMKGDLVGEMILRRDRRIAEVQEALDGFKEG